MSRTRRRLGLLCGAAVSAWPVVAHAAPEPAAATSQQQTADASSASDATSPATTQPSTSLAAVPQPQAAVTSPVPPTAPEADPAGDIVVTAQRREQRLQDVPIAVSVTSGAQLQQQNLVTLENVAARLPAVRVARNINSDTIAVRGVGSGQNAGFEQAVGVFVDGVYRGRSRSTRSALFDAERVEVLKGPQTIYFGNNTVAGAINIATRKPSDTFGIDARAYYAPGIGEYTLDLGVEGPLTGTLAFRVAGEATGMNGYVYNAYEGEDGPRNRDLAGRISLRWKPIAGFQSDLRVDRVHNRDVNTDYSELNNCPAPAIYGPTTGACALYLAQRGANADTSFDRRNYTLGLFFRYDMTEIAWTNRLDVGEDVLTSTTSYFDHTAVVTSNSQPVALVTPFPNVVARGIFRNPETDRNFTQELRLESPAGRLFQYTVGLYYLHDVLTSNGFPGFYTAAYGATYAPAFYTSSDLIALNRQLHQVTDTKSAFAAFTVKPVDSLRINVGARYTSVRKDAHRYALYGKAGPIPGFENFVAAPAAAQPLLFKGLGGSPTDFAEPVATFDKLMPSASIQYDVVPSMTLYASYTNGFKAGGFAEASTPNIFGSETVDAYEVGVKGSIPGAGVFYTLDAFTSSFSNLQVAYTFVNPAGVSSSLIANAAKARSRGVEGSLSVRASPALSFKTDLSYVDARYLEYTNGPCSDIQLVAKPQGCVQDESGLRRPFAPAWSGSVGATLNIPAGDQRVRVEPLLYFASDANLSETLDPLLEQKGYAKVDLRIGYGPESGRWEIAVVGKNLTDKYTYSLAKTLSTSKGSVIVYPDAPRTIAISGSIRF